jgi:hypothetical protein
MAKDGSQVAAFQNILASQDCVGTRKIEIVSTDRDISCVASVMALMLSIMAGMLHDMLYSFGRHAGLGRKNLSALRADTRRRLRSSLVLLRGYFQHRP